MMASCDSDTTTIAVEYPYAYDKDAEKGNIPYYPVFTGDSEAAYQAYVKLVEKVDNLYLLGRLAEYRYYNMDAIVERAVTFAEEL